VRDDVVGNLIQLISEKTSLHAYAVKQVWKHLDDELSNKQPLVQVAMWTIGEYADLLNTYINEDGDEEQVHVEEEQVISMCEEIVNSSLMSIVTKEYTISALIKLSARFPSFAFRIKKTIDAFEDHMNVELQQRSVEFSIIFSKYNNLRVSLLEKMPPIESSNDKKENLHNGLLNEEETLDSDLVSSNLEKTISTNQASSAALLDLLDDVSSNQTETSTSTFTSTSNPMTNLSNNLLDDLLGIDLSNSNQSNNNNFLNLNNSNNPLNYGIDNQNSNVNLNILDGFTSPKVESKVSSSIPSITAFEKDGLKLVFHFEQNLDNPKTITIHLIATNSNENSISDFLFQAAVPKVTCTTTDSSNLKVYLILFYFLDIPIAIIATNGFSNSSE